MKLLRGFREQVYCGNVLYEYNPVLNFAMSNAVIRTNQGLIKIDKDATTKRIDPVDSTLLDLSWQCIMNSDPATRRNRSIFGK